MPRLQTKVLTTCGAFRAIDILYPIMKVKFSPVSRPGTVNSLSQTRTRFIGSTHQGVISGLVVDDVEHLEVGAVSC